MAVLFDEHEGTGEWLGKREGVFIVITIIIVFKVAVCTTLHRTSNSRCCPISPDRKSVVGICAPSYDQ